MGLVRLIMGAIIGALAGLVLAFAVGIAALLLFDSAKEDPSGLYGLLAVIAWTPLGGGVGLIVGAWAARRGRTIRPPRRPDEA